MAIFALPHDFAEKREDGIWSLHKEPQMELGECFMPDRDALMTSYVRFASAVAKGDALSCRIPLVANVTVDVSEDGNITAGSREINFNASTSLATLVSDDLLPKSSTKREHAFLKARAGTTTKLAIVTEFTDTRLTVIWDTDDGLLDAAFTADTTLNLTAPWIVKKAATGEAVVGFAQRDAKAKEYGLILVQGFGWVQAGAAIAAGEPLRPSGDGEVDDEAEADVTAEPAIATSLVPGAADGEVIWGHAFCKPISKVIFMSEPFLRGTKRPGE